MSTMTNSRFKAPSRKYKTLRMHADLFFNMALNHTTYYEGFDGSTFVRAIRHDLPEGTEIQAVNFDDVYGWICLRLWNDAWPEVGEAEIIPAIDITFQAKEICVRCQHTHPGGLLTVAEPVDIPSTPVNWREFL